MNDRRDDAATHSASIYSTVLSCRKSLLYIGEGFRRVDESMYKYQQLLTMTG